MQLVGMLDSPYVRRVAVSLRLLGLPFEHRSVSVFRQFDDFAAVNPVVKAPTLVCDDGTVLMDSTLILEHAEDLAAAGGRRSLVPGDAAERLYERRVLGLALAACEKCVQIVYEQTLRPTEKQHAPWLDRVRAQMRTAFDLLEAEIATRPLAATSAAITQAGVTAAVAWQFTQAARPGELAAGAYPALMAHGESAEALAEFVAFPPD